MAGEFVETTLGRLLSFANGRSSPERADGLPYPVYGSNGVIGCAAEANSAEGSIIIGRVGSYCGSLYLSKQRCWVTDNAIRATALDNNDSRFLFYLLGMLSLNSWRAGSGQPLLNQDILTRIPASAPGPAEQRAIAHILGTLDDKIEMNRRMSATLEAMARALFKSWFVDFDPVRAKAEGRDPGLPIHLAALFPDRLVETEQGEIPEGWEVKPLSDCVDVARGLSYKGSGLSEEGVPMHNLNSIYEGGGYKHDGLKRYNGDYKSQHVARAGDLIVANTEQGHHRLLIGYAAIVPTRFGQKNLFSHHIYRIRPKRDCWLTVDYLCHLLNTSVMHDLVSGYANGTTVNMLPIDGLQSPIILVPPARAVSAFCGVAGAARMRHEEMFEESRTLAALRDTLLPKLISGELRVKDAETFLDRVL